MTDEAAAAGRIERSDAELVERSFSVGDRRAGQIMVSRHDVVTVRATVSVNEALRIAVEAGHRRLPVVDDHSGAIIGVVRVRDLAHAATTDPMSDITDHMRDTFSVPESQRAIEVLRHMQSSGEHLAVVTDEESVGSVGFSPSKTSSKNSSERSKSQSAADAPRRYDARELQGRGLSRRRFAVAPPAGPTRAMSLHANKSRGNSSLPWANASDESSRGQVARKLIARARHSVRSTSKPETTSSSSSVISV